MSKTALLSLVAAPLLSGCVAYSAATAPDEPYFDHLRDGDIAEFDQRIEADLQTDTVNDKTRVGIAWLNFLTCGEPGEDSPADPAYRWAHALLRFEDARRATYVIARRQEPAEMGDLFYGRLAADSPLNWEPGEELDADIVWPAEEEDWADELAAAAPVERTCPDLLDRLLPRSEEDDTRPAGFEPLLPWYGRQFQSIRDANQAAIEAGDELAGPARTLDLQVNLFAVGLAAQLAELAADRDDLEMPEELTLQVEEGLRGAVRRAQADGLVENEALAAAHFVLGHLRVQQGDPSGAREQIIAARKAGPASTLKWPVRHVELWIYWVERDWQAIADLPDALPPTTFRNFGSYVHWKSIGVLRAGHEDRFLAIVTQAMADRDWSNSPYLEATWGAVMRYLTEVPFDDRVVELVENLGPKTATYERMEELGRTALDLGRPEVADDTAAWLLGRDSNARRHARYYAIRAMADFLRDDKRAFREEIRQITRRDPRLLEAIPKSRQARFFEHADRELARILAQTMPMMAEWGDDDAAQASRRAWLKLLVEEIQLFLRTAEETSARSQLIELYRLASELLSDHPRGYAERVGRENGDPILLGTVRVEDRHFGSELEFSRGRYDFPRFFAPIPNDTSVGQWDTSWPAFDPAEEVDE